MLEPGLAGMFMCFFPPTITALRLSAGSTRFSVCWIWALMMSQRAPAVAPLHRLDQFAMFGDQLGRIVVPDIGEADAHQPIGLSDQVAQRAGHAAVAGGVRERGVEGAVIGDEILAIPGKASEAVERFEGFVRRVLDRFRDAGRLQRQAKSQQVARIRKRDRIDAIALARLHGDEMLALQPQQGFADRLAADGIAFGELLLAHVVAGREPAA